MNEQQDNQARVRLYVDGELDAEQRRALESDLAADEGLRGLEIVDRDMWGPQHARNKDRNILALFLVTYIPQLSLWLPSLFDL